jgi:hypothetical protein
MSCCVARYRRSCEKQAADARITGNANATTNSNFQWPDMRGGEGFSLKG